MLFEIQRETLLRPLQLVIGVVERRQTLPILANVLLIAENDGISLTTTDLEVELQATAPNKVAETGQITLPARKFMEIVRNLPDGGAITIELDKNQAILTSGRSRFTLTTLPAGDYPSVEDIGETQTLELSQAQFRWLIDKTHFAMALQDVRYYLNGLLVEMEPRYLRAVATDGHRLATAEFATETKLEKARQVIVPRKGIQELLRLLEHSEERVNVELGTNHIRVRVPGLRFTSKLIDGRYPDYERVIPDGSGWNIQIDRETLRQALVRASILSNEKYRGIRLSLRDNQLSISSENPEQESAVEEIPVAYEGAGLEMGFNAGYILEALGAVEEKTISVTVTDASASALIMGEGEPAARYVVMPMRL